jgi:hypothetical protein
MARSYSLYLCLALLTPAFAAAQPPDRRDVGICNQLFGPASGVKGVSGVTLPARTLGVFDLCFDGDTWHVQLPPNPRITSRDPVWIRVRHFNFLRYTLSYDVKEEQAQSYAYLTRLWSSVLSPELGSLLVGLSETQRPPELPLIEASRVVYQNAQLVQRKIEAAIAPHRRPGLTREELTALSAATGEVKAAVSQLVTAFAALQKIAESDTEGFKAAFGASTSRYYKLAVDSYATAAARADSFLSLAERSLGDDVKKIGTRDAGTRVTVTLSATDPSGEKKDVETVHYFVQSGMPLVAHGGVAVTGIKNVTFQKVSRAVQFSQEDFFQQQGTGNAVKSFSVFLGWQFFARVTSLDLDAKQQPVSVLLSMGTDLSSPGNRIFIGPSVMLFGRFVVTGGAAIGRESEGAEPLEPNVFRVVRDRGKTSWFASASIRVY